ncbi:SURF1 family cytochrome oxidase biogenesis protein [Acuticoccus yangtzensis]|uniref:SURF1 family protein n=1 Tax=Acuticoccus yangtzensis TaxID=1443441 RepID=UPI0009496381
MTATTGRGPSRRARIAAIVLILIAGAGFTALGVWQVERRAWKLDLIDRVEARLAAAPTPAPGPAEWAGAGTPGWDRAYEYRPVTLTGRFDGPGVPVKAVTALGSGFWLVAPFTDTRGFTVLVNRGFVTDPATPNAAPAPDAPAPGATGGDDAAPVPVGETVVGLLRLSEPGGGFLRSNQPGAGRWFSRDVAAISETLDLADAAPYFVDAAATPDAPDGAPVGGLTVLTFRNSHLVYALTWFTLAALSLVALVLVLRRGRSTARRPAPSPRP